MSEPRARYPHTPGRTSLSYSTCGKYLLTTGDDLLVRRFEVGSTGEPETIDLDFKGLSLASTDTHFAVAGESGVCKLYDLASQSSVSTLARASLPLRSVRFSPNGEWCCITGDDYCRLVNTEDITITKTVPVSDVRHVNFHPSQPSVVSVSSFDGSVYVYDLDADTRLGLVEQTVPKVNDWSDGRTTDAVWSPQGESLALPNKTFDIALVDTRDWLISVRLEKGHSNAITCLSFSPNGRYLASSGKDDKVLIWSMATREVVRSMNIAGVCELAWHPHANELSCVTLSGQLYNVDKVLEENMTAPFGGEVFNPLAQSKVSTIAAESNDASLGEDFDELFVSDKEDTETTKWNDRQETRQDLDRERMSRRTESSRKRHKLNASLGSIQPSFQSGATPWLNNRRFLCMSPVGYVWTVRQSSEHHSVTITFFDQSEHREVHIQDSDLWDLAAVTAEAAVLANSKTGQFSVRFHSTYRDNWSQELDLSIDKGISCVALSSEVVVVFTRAGYMRAYTLYGSPLLVSRAGGSSGTVITCAAHNNEVFSVYQQSPTTFVYNFEDVALGKFHQKNDALEIAPGSSLTGALFSEDGEPCIMDSTGVLSTLVKGRTQGQARWMPVFSPPKPVDADLLSKRYWPIGVTESKLICVILRGQQQFPSIPLPITDETDLCVPGLGESEGQFLVMRSQFLQAQDRAEYRLKITGEEEVDEEIQQNLDVLAIELDKMLLRQFQAACSDQRLSRGLQLVSMVQQPESLHAAAKIAAAYEQTNIASKIMEMLE